MKKTMIIISTVIGLILLISAVEYVTGITIIDDPGEHNVDVTIVNDSNRPLTIKQCVGDNGSCQKFIDTGTYILKHDQTVHVNGSNDDVHQPWVVYISSKVVGCFDLNYPGSVTKDTYLLSSMTPATRSESCSKPR